MPKEIERKYLVKEVPLNIDTHKKHNIEQGYLGVAKDKSELRIRKIDEEIFLTHKSGEGFSREEVEIRISQEMYNILWPKTEGKRISKTRIRIPHNDLIIELDIFGIEQSGLKLAEVEFKSESDFDSFQTPAWFGKDVTHDSQYKNQNLAR